jgi:hypothetical protein
VCGPHFLDGRGSTTFSELRSLRALAPKSHTLSLEGTVNLYACRRCHSRLAAPSAHPAKHSPPRARTSLAADDGDDVRRLARCGAARAPRRAEPVGRPPSPAWAASRLRGPGRAGRLCCRARGALCAPRRGARHLAPRPLCDARGAPPRRGGGGLHAPLVLGGHRDAAGVAPRGAEPDSKVGPPRARRRSLCRLARGARPRDPRALRHERALE